MTRITIKLSIKELELLASLASDQMFRREFIEPKMPGYKSNSGEIGLGKELVARLETMLDSASMQEKSRPHRRRT